MKVCEVCGQEIDGGDYENRCRDCEEHEAATKAKRAARSLARRERDAIMESCGLIKVRGGCGGTYWD